MPLTSNYTTQAYKTYKHIEKELREVGRENFFNDPIQDYYLEKGLELAIKFGHQYATQAYKTYKHIEKGWGEIGYERFLYDPLQDYYLEKGLELAIKFGHQTDVITSGYAGFHGLLHKIPLPFGLNVHTPGIKLITLAVGFKVNFLKIGFQKSFTLSTPGAELLLHLGFNALLTASFIVVYPALNSSWVVSAPLEIKYIAIESTRFFGSGPLEIMHSAKSVAKSTLGEDNSIVKLIEYLSYGENYIQYRASDEGYKQTMDCYNNYMEFGDAIMHAFVELSLILKNQHLSTMPILHIYLQTRLYLYENTNAEEEANNKKIEILKLPHNNKSCTDDPHDHSLAEKSSTWGEWLYLNANWAYKNQLYTGYYAAKTAHIIYTLYRACAPIVKILSPYYTAYHWKFMGEDHEDQHILIPSALNNVAIVNYDLGVARDHIANQIITAFSDTLDQAFVLRDDEIAQNTRALELEVVNVENEPAASFEGADLTSPSSSLESLFDITSSEMNEGSMTDDYPYCMPVGSVPAPSMSVEPSSSPLGCCSISDTFIEEGMQLIME